MLPGNVAGTDMRKVNKFQAVLGQPQSALPHGQVTRFLKSPSVADGGLVFGCNVLRCS